MAQSLVKVVLRFQESPSEDLDVATAFTKQPDIVREALLEAIRHFQLPSIDITLLRIENIFRSTLKTALTVPNTLRPILEACRQGKLQHRTEKLFFEHGKEYGIALLCVVTRDKENRLLFREIDPLQDDELIMLIKNINNLPKKASIVEFIEEFIQAPKLITPDLPSKLKRPRTRKKGFERSPSPQATHPASGIHQSNKKRKLGDGQVLPGDDPRQYRLLPSPRQAGFYQGPHAIPRTPPVLQSSSSYNNGQTLTDTWHALDLPSIFNEQILGQEGWSDTTVLPIHHQHFAPHVPNYPAPTSLHNGGEVVRNVRATHYYDGRRLLREEPNLNPITPIQLQQIEAPLQNIVPQTASKQQVQPPPATSTHLLRADGRDYCDTILLSTLCQSLQSLVNESHTVDVRLTNECVTTKNGWIIWEFDKSSSLLLAKWVSGPKATLPNLPPVLTVSNICRFLTSQQDEEVIVRYGKDYDPAPLVEVKGSIKAGIIVRREIYHKIIHNCNLNG